MRTSDLAPTLSLWIWHHDLEHPRKRVEAVEPGGKNLFHFSAARFICDSAHITGQQLQRIVTCEVSHAFLSVADDVLNVIEEYDRLGSEIPIYGNPEWPRRRVLRELGRRGVDIDDPFWSWEDSALGI